MTDITAPPVRPPRTPATVGDITRAPATAVEPNDHVAAAAYLMKHAGATALVIVDPRTGRPASSPRRTSPTPSRTARTSTMPGSTT
jgi:hypothetical protein